MCCVISQETYDSVIAELNEIPERHKTLQKETWDFYKTNEKILTSMLYIPVDLCRHTESQQKPH